MPHCQCQVPNTHMTLFLSSFYHFITQNKKLIGHQTSTQVLRDLEISLRTNHIQYVYSAMSLYGLLMGLNNP